MIEDGPLDKLRPGRDMIDEPSTQIIQHHNRVPSLDQVTCDARPDKPGAAGDERLRHQMNSILAMNPERQN